MCLISDIYFLPLFDSLINVIKNIQFKIVSIRVNLVLAILVVIPTIVLTIERE